jgi:hypothetical protein
VSHLLEVASNNNALWNQQTNVARVVEFNGGGVRDVGLEPLAHFVDASGPDAIAITVETEATETSTPPFKCAAAER